jgi:hypothetical protein
VLNRKNNNFGHFLITGTIKKEVKKSRYFFSIAEVLWLVIHAVLRLSQKIRVIFSFCE